MKFKQKSLKSLLSGGILIMSVVFTIPAIGAEQATKSGPAAFELQKSFISVIKRVKPSVVDISAKKTVTRQQTQQDPFGGMFDDPMFQQFFRRFPPSVPQRQELQSRGSGVIIRKDGYILTNNHVVAQADQLTVTLSDGRTKEAKIIGNDESTDLAVIKIDGDNYPEAELGDSDVLEVGQIVFTFGSPFSFSGSVSQGIISGMGRELGLSQYENLIQTDAAMNPGNSGGPLVDLNGRIVGINKAIATQGVAQSAGLGFAIPINLARQVMGDLIQNGKWTRGYLGIFMDELNAEKAQQMGLSQNKGVLVAKVVENSPAANSGLKEYDVIISFNNKPVETVYELQSMVAMTKALQTVPVKVIRDGKEVVLNVKIGERTDESDALASDSYKKWGLTLQLLSENLAKQRGVNYIANTLIITAVDQDSQAFQLGFRENDIILEIDRKPAKDLKEIIKSFSAKKSGEKILFRTLSQQGAYKIISFPVPEKDK